MCRGSWKTARIMATAVRYAMLAAGIGCVGLFSGVAAGQGGGLAEIDVPLTPIETETLAGFEALATVVERENPATIATPEAAGSTEEVIVRGRSPAALRIQIELAEEALYDRFNEINSNDEFDIHCKEIAFTGSRMLTRFCQPNFWHTAEERLAYDTVLMLQGSAFSANPGLFRGEQRYKRVLMLEEMRRLAREDEEFIDALRRLYTLTLGDEPASAD